MRANRRRDTALEVAVRSQLHREGLRFRVDFPSALEGQADSAGHRLHPAPDLCGARRLLVARLRRMRPAGD